MDIFNFGNDNNQEAKRIIAEGKRKISSIATITVVMVVILAIVSVFLAVYLTKQSLYSDIYDSITKEITQEKLDEYAREYYIPAGYTDDTVGIVEAGSKSVVTLKSQYYDYTGSQASAVTSSGTGFVVTEDGYIVTNAHVVTHTDRIGRTSFNNLIKATIFGSETELSITGIAFDINSDIAIIKIVDAISGLVPVTFGDSDALKMGQRVVAVGNAGGLGISSTIGVVSRPAEVLSVNIGYGNTKVIQTDAAVNPGNSGGPLYDYHATVDGTPSPYCVGVVSFKLANDSSNNYENMGFAVASSEIIAFLDDNGITDYKTCKAN